MAACLVVSNGVKGGTGKTQVCRYFVDHFLETCPFVIDTDDGNSDVAACYTNHDETGKGGCSVVAYKATMQRGLRGIMEDAGAALESGRNVILNCGARNQDETAKFMPDLALMCQAIGADMVVSWTLGKDRVSLKQLEDFLGMMKKADGYRLVIMKNMGLVPDGDAGYFDYIKAHKFALLPSVFFPMLYDPMLEAMGDPNWKAVHEVLDSLPIGSRFLSRKPMELARKAVSKALTVAKPASEIEKLIKEGGKLIKEAQND